DHFAVANGEIEWLTGVDRTVKLLPSRKPPGIVNADMAALLRGLAVAHANVPIEQTGGHFHSLAGYLRGRCGIGSRRLLSCALSDCEHNGERHDDGNTCNVFRH